MFSSYKINDYTVPNNMTSKFPSCTASSKLCPMDKGKPYEQYDAKGNLVGYFWNYGETLNLEFNITGELTIESDAIVYTMPSESPTEHTRGYVGQQAYNVAEFKSWTCTSVVEEYYIWTENEDFNPQGSKNLYISASDYLKDKELVFTVYNFRHESIWSTTHAGTSRLIIPITKERSAKMLKGIYYCSLSVVGEDVSMTIFNHNDCILLVK